MIEINGKQMTLGLSMIVKDEEETLIKALDSVKGFVDEIVVNWNGTNPKTKEILEKYGAKIYQWKWNDNFSDARNYALGKSTADFILWLDSDDEVISPDLMIDSCKKLFAQPDIGAIWSEWLYGFDSNGNCIMKLWRERIIRRGWFQWQASLHETLIARVYCQHIMTNGFKIKHNATQEQIKASAKRNLKIIKALYEKEHQEGEIIDPKTTLDLARTLESEGYHADAIEIYREYVATGGFDDDRFLAYIKMAEIYRMNGKHDSAFNSDLLAMKMKPDWPDSFLGLGYTYYLMGRWTECIDTILTGMSKKIPFGRIPLDPMSYTARPLLLLQYAYFQTGEFQKTLDICDKILADYYPDHKIAKQMKENCETILKEERLTNAIMEIKKELEAGNHEKQLAALPLAVPEYMQDHPVISRLKNKYHGVKKNNRVVFFCGPSFESWSPLHLKTGIGGSEEAVIYLGRELSKLGWYVDVYCECDITANYDGVQYHNVYEYDANEKCDIFIAWRMPEFTKFAPGKGEVVILWNHDIQKPEYYNENILNKIDKIFMLSKYHRDNLKDFPDDKFWITSNGIIPEQFEDKEVHKVPYKCIYASSPDGGLNILLAKWPEIRKAHPEASLHIFYGFTKIYDELHKDDYLMTKFKENIMDMIKQPGIIYRGRVGHEELAKEMLSSEFWLYPTNFTEISCITAIKAQAAGTYPITTDTAALSETVQYGIKVSGDIGKQDVQKRWLANVLEMMAVRDKLPQIEEMKEWAKKTYDWKTVAKNWSDKFKELSEAKNVKETDNVVAIEEGKKIHETSTSSLGESRVVHVNGSDVETAEKAD